MRTTTIYGKYELKENGEVVNTTTGKQLKIEETSSGRVVKLYVDSKTKRVNIDTLIEENFPKIDINFNPTSENSNIEKNKKKRKTKYIVRVTELNGTINDFSTFKAANDYYGLRKDYLNYCLTDKYAYMLTKNGLKLKSVEKVSIEQTSQNLSKDIQSYSSELNQAQ